MIEFTNYYPNIKFTHESIKDNIAYPDLKASLSVRKLNTDHHSERTDRQEYLYKASAHPAHTKLSTISSKALRMSRIVPIRLVLRKVLWV